MISWTMIFSVGNLIPPLCLRRRLRDGILLLLGSWTAAATHRILLDLEAMPYNIRGWGVQTLSRCRNLVAEYVLILFILRNSDFITRPSKAAALPFASTERPRISALHARVKTGEMSMVLRRIDTPDKIPREVFPPQPFEDIVNAMDTNISRGFNGFNFH